MGGEQGKFSVSFEEIFSSQGCKQLGSIRTGGKYGHMTYNSHVQEHRSVTKECFISALNSIYSALLHPCTT